jgi:hypothetical protein
MCAPQAVRMTDELIYTITARRAYDEAHITANEKHTLTKHKVCSNLVVKLSKCIGASGGRGCVLASWYDCISGACVHNVLLYCCCLLLYCSVAFLYYCRRASILLPSHFYAAVFATYSCTHEQRICIPINAILSCVTTMLCRNPPRQCIHWGSQPQPQPQVYNFTRSTTVKKREVCCIVFKLISKYVRQRLCLTSHKLCANYYCTNYYFPGSPREPTPCIHTYTTYRNIYTRIHICTSTETVYDIHRHGKLSLLSAQGTYEIPSYNMHSSSIFSCVTSAT